MFRLAHISDVHLGPLPDVPYRDLVSKRITGYVNWHRNRRQFLHDSVIDAIVGDINAAAPDHIAVTGDLVNLALDIEIDMARQWLELLGGPDRVSVVPGNHDAYVPGAFDKVCRAWGNWMTSDGANAPADRHAFPYLKVRGNIALIGVTSARATAPFMATGYFREQQARRLASMLDETGSRGLFRVVMIHHPPVRHAVGPHKRLFGIRRFQNTVLQPRRRTRSARPFAHAKPLHHRGKGWPGTGGRRRCGRSGARWLEAGGAVEPARYFG